VSEKHFILTEPARDGELPSDRVVDQFEILQIAPSHDCESLRQVCVVLDYRMLTTPGLLLRIEGGAMLATTLVCYQETHSRWIVFAALLLVPDLSLAGYLGGVKIGATVYNLVHTLTGPLVLIGYSIFAMHFWLLPYGLIWTAHIGMDRMLGFGLKYPTRFNDTHLQRT
jgi:hypothetical protein